MLLVSPSRWWVLAVQGFLNIAFGFSALVYPNFSSSFLAVIFAALAVANGVIGILVALRERRYLQYWWLSAIIGLINLGMGVFILCYSFLVTAVSNDFLSIFIGIQALVQGSMGFGISLEMNREFKVKGAFLFYGILSISGGILVLAVPYTHIMELLSLIGVYALLAGIGQALDSLRLKHMMR